MQLLPSPVETVAPHRRVDAAIMLPVEFFAVAAVILVGFPDVLQLTRHQLEDDHVIKVPDDRYLIGKDVFGVAEIHERSEDAFPVDNRQLPLVIGQHLQHRIEIRQTCCDKVGQRLALANIVDDATDGVDNFGLVGAAHDVARSFQCISKKAQVTIAEFEGYL